MTLAKAIALAAVTIPLMTTVASSNELAKGKAQFARCQSCHLIEQSDKKRIGPNLFGIIGTPAGKVEGFAYSKGLAEADFIWTRETLDAFIERPRNVIPGTSMVFAGIKDPNARKALIDYIESVK